jgi:hypothetical protein
MKQGEEIKRLNNYIMNQGKEKKKVDDEIRKILEVNFNLKTQIENSKRLMNNSTILDEILNCQRSPNDKSDLGYHKEVAHFEASTYNKHEESPSFSKGGSKVAIQVPTQRNETFRRIEQRRHQESIPTPKIKF